MDSEPETNPPYEQCELCEDGVAQLITTDWPTEVLVDERPNGPNGNATVTLYCEVPAYSCNKCGQLYTALGYEEAVTARVAEYRETGE